MRHSSTIFLKCGKTARGKCHKTCVEISKPCSRDQHYIFLPCIASGLVYNFVEYIDLNSSERGHRWSNKYCLIRYRLDLRNHCLVECNSREELAMQELVWT